MHGSRTLTKIKIWYRNPSKSDHWPLCRWWKNRMTTQNLQKLNAKNPQNWCNFIKMYFSVNGPNNQNNNRGGRFGGGSSDTSGPVRQTYSRHNSQESSVSSNIVSRYSRRESVTQTKRELGPVRESKLYISFIIIASKLTQYYIPSIT